VTRADQDWGIRVPFDEKFTIYVWFDAVLNYATGAGYGTDEAKFARWWPADIHFIGKDITRFHCALWPAMLMAAGVEPPRKVFGHGFVYVNKQKISKTLGNVVEPMDIIGRFGGDAFRYYFMRECPFPGDGEFSFQRFEEVYNADLANNLGNLYSRVVTLVTRNYEGVLPAASRSFADRSPEQGDGATAVEKVRAHVEACEYNVALQSVWQQFLDPANRYADRQEPWKLVKTDKAATAYVLRNLVEALRGATILLKPFIPRTAEKVYRSFSFAEPWDRVCYDSVRSPVPAGDAIRVTAPLDANGKVTPLFPRIA
jgi:methionyl-tRNA synthetase